MRIIETLRRPGVTIDAADTVGEAARIMERTGVGALAVLDGDVVVGIVTDRDLVRRAMAPGLAPTARVDGVMSMPVDTIDGDCDLHQTVAAIRAAGARRLVVLDHGRFAGLITVDDLVIDLAADLADLVHPVMGEVLFAHHDAPLPARLQS